MISQPFRRLFKLILNGQAQLSCKKKLNKKIYIYILLLVVVLSRYQNVCIRYRYQYQSKTQYFVLIKSNKKEMYTNQGNSLCLFNIVFPQVIKVWKTENEFHPNLISLLINEI